MSNNFFKYCSRKFTTNREKQHHLEKTEKKVTKTYHKQIFKIQTKKNTRSLAGNHQYIGNQKY